MKSPDAQHIRSRATLYATLVLVVFLSLYGLYQARDLIRGPVIVVNSPQNGAVLDRPLVTLKGSAENISAIALNGRPIFTDEHGHFSEQLLLPHGYTIITVEASNRFGAHTVKTLELVYQEPPAKNTPTSALMETRNGS